MESSSRLVIVTAAVANALIAVSKFVAAYFTGSSAMISEGIHSIVDTGDSLLLLFGMHQSRKPADEEHPFGHGKELYFWSLIVSMVIFGVGGGMSIYEGILHIAEPRLLEDAAWNYWVLAIAAVFESVSMVVTVREFWRVKPRGRGIWQTIHTSKDPTTYTVMFEDSAALIGLFIAFMGVYFGHRLQNPYLDGAASVLIGLLLAGVAIILAYESKGLLVGEAADREALQDICAIAQADPSVLKVDKPLTMYLAPNQVLLNLNIRFTPTLTIERLESTIDRIEAEIRERHPEIKGIFIEADSLRSAAPLPARPPQP